MSSQEYFEIAEKVTKLCDENGVKCILHSFVDVAIELGRKEIHLTMKDFVELDRQIKGRFDCIGVSTHSVEEAVYCAKNGAGYITSSHIFCTDCKKGLEPKGLDFLKEVVSEVKKISGMKVYALGGINMGNMESCRKMGADGVCMMSEYMVK